MRHFLRQLLLLLVPLGLAIGARGQATTTLRLEDFNSDGEGTRYNSNSALLNSQLPFDGALGHYFIRATDNAVQYPAGSGNIRFGTATNPAYIYSSPGVVAAAGFWAAEGVRDYNPTTATPTNRADPGYVELTGTTVSSYSGLQVSLKLADARGAGYVYGPNGVNPGASLSAPQAEIDDKILIQYSIDGGAWTTVGGFTGDNGTSSGNWRVLDPTTLQPVAGADVLTAVFKTYTYSIPVTGASLKVRVYFDERGATEEVAFDDVAIAGTINSTPAPTLANIESTDAAYTEGGSPVQVTNTLTVGAGTITGAVVSVSSGFKSAQDMLDATVSGSVTKSYNVTTGVLTLSGAASTSVYQAILRSVTYANSNTTNATGGTRTVQFVAYNGTTPGNSQSRNVVVTAILSGPANLPYMEDFETDGEGTRYASNTYVANNQLGWFRTNLNPNTAFTPVTFGNVSNSYYWYGEGTKNATNPSTVRIGYLETQTVNATNYRNLHYQVRLATGQSQQYEGTDDYFKLYYRVAGGSWTLFGAFYGNGTNNNGELQRDTDLNGTPDGLILNSTLTNVNFALPATLNGIIDFRTEFASDGQEELAFDLIQVTGTAPTTVTSLVRASPNPTNAATVNYTITFGSPITGLTAANFTLITSGLSGATVGTPVSTGTGSTWTVPVSTGTGSGNLTLSLTNDTGLSASIGTTLPFVGETYTVDKTAPTATITRQNPTGPATNATSVTFRVTFSEAVTGVSTSSFTLNTTGAVAGTLASVASVSTSVYDVVVSSVSGNGTLGITLKGTGVTDLAGNAATGVTAPTYTIDNLAPTVTFTSTPPSLSNSTVATFAFVGNDGTGSGVASYQASLNGGAYVAVTSPLTYSGLSNGTYTVQVRALDNAGNVGTPASYTFTVDTTPPTVTLSSSTVANGGFTTTSPVSFTAQFSKSVGTTFTLSDITVSSGTAGNFAAGAAANSYTFSVTPSAGPVSVSIAAGVAQDLAGNNNTAATPNPYAFTYALPVTAAPVLTQPANGSTTNGLPTFAGTAPAGSTVTIYLAMGSNAAQVIGTTTTTGGSFSFTPATALSSGSYAAYATAQTSGASVSANSNTNAFTVDATAPTVLSSNRQVPASATTNATSLTFRVTFSEPVTGVDASDFTLTTTAGTVSSSSRTVSAISSSVYDVTVSGVSGNGTVRLDLNASGTGIADAVGNPLSGGYTSGQPYTLDQTAPTVTLSTTSGSPTSTSPIPFAATFSEAVAGFSASGISVTGGTVTGGSFIGSGSGPYTFTVTPTGSGTVTASILASAAQDAAGNGSTASNSVSVFYTVPITFTSWTGNTSTDWFTASNWTAGVPTATTDATIPSAPSGNRFPLIASGTASTRNLTINSGAALTQTGGTLDVRADLTNNGTFGPTGGTVVLGTSVGANILGSGAVRFWNLTVNASGGQLSTSIGASVRNVLTLNGNFAPNGNVFTLASSASGDALVVNNSGVVSGTTTVQRYIDPSRNAGLGYRQYSAPVSNTTVADLATPTGFMPVVNPVYNTAAAPGSVTPFPTVYGYDDSRLSLTNNLSSFDKGYFSPAALSDPLLVGRGYTVNIGASELVDFQGTLNNGDLPLNLTSTRPTYPDGGWQLLGNPYPAPLDYSRVAAADKVNMDGAVYVFSSTSQYGGQYRAYNNGFGNPIIPMGQAFFARVAAGYSTGSFTFRNSQRLTAPSTTTFQRTAETRPLVQLTLQGAGSAGLTDELYVYTQSGATPSFDADFDASKLTNPSGLNLAAQAAGGQWLAIDGLPALGTASQVVPLVVSVPAPGSYTLVAAQLLNLSTVPVYLRDSQTGALLDLAQQPSYAFTVANAAALLPNRFELVFSPQQPLATAPAALAEQVALYPNPATTSAWLELPLSLSHQPVTATLVDAVGRAVRTQVLPAGRTSHQLLLNDLATGVYAVRLRTDAGVVVKKLILE